MASFFDTYIDITPPLTTGWQTVDLSAHGVPADAVAIIRVYQSDITNQYIGARKYGSTDNRATLSYHVYNQAPIYVGCNAANKINLYRASTSVNYYLCGYLLSSEAVYFTNGYDKTPGTLVWTTTTCSEVPLGAIYAIFESCIGFSDGVDFRKTGSTDVRNPAGNCGHSWFIVGLNDSKQCDIWREGTLANSIFLVGYVLIGTSKTNALDKSLTTTGTYVDIDLSADAPSNAVAAIVLVNQGVYNYAFDLRKNGISQEFYYNGKSANGTFLVPLDVDKKLEGKIESTYVDFFVLGYIHGTADFSATPLNGVAPLTVNFTDLSTGIPTSWKWEYSKDGGAWTEFSTSQNPSHTFTQAGYYSIRLTATNAEGSDTETKTDYILVAVTLANFNESTPKYRLQGGTNDAELIVPKYRILAGMDGVIATAPRYRLQGGGYWTDYLLCKSPRYRLSAISYQTLNEIIATAPKYRIVATTAPYADIIITAPRYRILAEAIHGAVGNISGKVPKYHLNAQLSAWNTGIAILTAPKYRLSAYTAAVAILKTPGYKLDAYLATGNIGSIDIKSPHYQLQGVCWVDPGGVLIERTPHYRLNAYLEVPIVMSADLHCPRMRLSAYGLTGQVAAAILTAPKYRITAQGYGEYICNAILIAPSYKLSAFMQTAGVANYTVYAVNLRNFAISDYTNYNFNSFYKFENLCLGASSEGIFLLEGDKDDDTSIDALIKTGKMDLNTSFLKRLTDAYLSMKAGGSYELILQADDGTERAHRIIDSKTDLHIKKKDLTHMKGNLWTVAFKNIDGSDFETNSLEFNVDVLKRKIKG